MSKRWPDKKIVGLTGNIATGKSAVMRLADERGALTVDADEIVHEILENDSNVQEAIVAAFGSSVQAEDGAIDRAALASIVFGDEDALRKLEQMLHPAVRRKALRRIDESEASVVIMEAIKLLEGGLVDVCDEVWVTRCPRKVQIQRLMVCRGLDGESAALRVNAQNPQEAKVARADVVIDTDGTMAQTKAQFERAWERLAQSLPLEEAVPAADGGPQDSSEAKEAPAAAPERQQPPPESSDVIARRARPSDIPTILLLMRKATGGEVKMTRAEMLMSFSERSYLIGQSGTEINMVVGWNTDSTTAVCIDQIYVHPLPAVAVMGPPLLDEIERSAQELICEVALAFLPHEVPREIRQILTQAGYRQTDESEMRRAWQETVQERQPPDTFIMAKVLRDIRVA